MLIVWPTSLACATGCWRNSCRHCGGIQCIFLFYSLLTIYHSEIHHTLAWFRLSSIAFLVAGTTTGMKCIKLSHSPGHDSISPVLFHTAGPDLPVLVLNPFLHFMFTATFLSQWKISLSLHTTKRVLCMTPKNSPFWPNPSSIKTFGKC